MCIDEFNGDNFDHGPLGFVGGGYLGQVQTNGRPIETTPVPKDTPKWGAAWKKAVADNYLSNLKGGSIHGSMYSYRDVYLDLDPTYKDRFGRPLMRMTIDFHDNELKAAAYMTDKYAEIVKAMGAEKVEKKPRKGPYDVSTYQTTHLNGGAVMGADRKTSALNRYLQSWDVPNLFVTGASAFPQNAGYNPTGTVARARLLGGQGDPRAIPEKAGAAGRCVRPLTCALGFAALAAAVILRPGRSPPPATPMSKTSP